MGKASRWRGQEVGTNVQSRVTPSSEGTELDDHVPKFPLMQLALKRCIMGRSYPVAMPYFLDKLVLDASLVPHFFCHLLLLGDLLG